MMPFAEDDEAYEASGGEEVPLLTHSDLDHRMSGAPRVRVWMGVVCCGALLVIGFAFTFAYRPSVHPSGSTGDVDVVHIYVYSYTELAREARLPVADLHECGHFVFSPVKRSWVDTYAAEYWITMKMIKWQRATTGSYSISWSYQDDGQDYTPHWESPNKTGPRVLGPRLQFVFTDDAALADFFFVPQLSSCVLNAHILNGTQHPHDATIRDYLRPILDVVIGRYPYWNSSNDVETPGANHIMVFTTDWGACSYASVMPLLRHTILAQGFGIRMSSSSALRSTRDADAWCASSSQDIVIPQASWSAPLSSLLEPSQMAFIRMNQFVRVPYDNPVMSRKYLMFMQGSVNFAHDTDQVYSKGVRQALAAISANLTQADPTQTLLLVRSGFSGNYHEELRQSRIGICARGWAPWTSRLQDVMNRESIPLIIADEIVLPFEGLIDWPSFAIKVNQSNLHTIVSRACALSETDLMNKQRELWLHAQYFSWHGDDRFNAFAMLLREVAMKKLCTNSSRCARKLPPVAFKEFW